MTTPSSSTSTWSSSSSSNTKVGPRAKCDQVVYETIAKAAEIIVRGRCHVDDNNDNSACSNSNNGDYSNHHDSNNGGRGGVGSSSGRRKAQSFRENRSGTNTGGGMGTSVSRFHLEVDEVELVRSILHNWRKSLHIPLRLDIYYEYQTLANNDDGPCKSTGNGSSEPATITRKDLLERWCIDYIPTFDSPSSSPTSQEPPAQFSSHQPGPVKRANCMDETILQLRQVVKRVIIFLRVLNSFTRIMPGYKLHHALKVEREYLEQQKYSNQQQHSQYQYNIYNQYYGNRLEGGGPGLRGGYYNTNDNTAQQTSPSSLSSEKQNLIGGSIKFLFYVSSDANTTNGMKSRASSPAEQRDLNLTQQRLFSSTTNSPFARHDLSPIPTPYGTLYFTALYDQSVNIKRVMMDRAQRLMEWDRLMNVGSGDSATISKAIPIKRNDDGGNNHPHHQQQDGYMDHYQNQNRRHSYNPATFVQTGHSNQLYRHQQQHQQQPMSLPNNVISNHLIHNYAKSPVEASGMDIAAYKLRDRVQSDQGCRRRNSGGKRVLSGLSLALMNDQQEEGVNSQQQSQQEQPEKSINAKLSSSPSTAYPIKIPTTLSQSPVPPTASNEEAASWKQRVALHHPPPSFFEVPSLASESSSDYQHQSNFSNAQKYGYGYNNGKGITIPVQNFRDSNSPSPVVSLVNTPPQPMFIGSFPRHGIEQMPKGTNNRDIDESSSLQRSPPFRNPDSLQEITSTLGSPSLNAQSIVQPMRSGIPFTSGMVSSNSLAQGQSSNTTENLLLPPLTKSDGLASSPFKFSVLGSNPNLPYNTGSAFSSLTLGKGSAMAFGQESGGLPLVGTSGMFGGNVGISSSMAIGRSGGELMFHNRGNAGVNFDKDQFDSEDMPFAIEDTDVQGTMMTSTSANSTGGLKQASNNDSNLPMSFSFGTVSSQVVTSFAHKCATAQPLQLFNSSANVIHSGDKNEGNEEMHNIEQSMDALSCQLDDFKAFGESIMSSTA